MKKKNILFTLLTFFFLVGCAGGETSSSNTTTNPPISEGDSSSSNEEVIDSFSFEKKEITVIEDTITTVSFTSSRKPTFESSDSTIASLSQTGSLIAKNAGEVTIKGKVGKVEDTLKVKVIKDTSNDYEIVLDTSYLVLTLEEGNNEKTISPILKLSGEEIANTKFNFASTNKEILSVTENGKISAIKEGKAGVEISTDKVSYTLTVDIYTKYVSTTTDWLNMVSDYDNSTHRYALKNDIDFSGITYVCNPNVVEGPDSKAFRGELNGFGHIVSNISYKNTDNFQSIFGNLNHSIIRNVSFENVRFASATKDAYLSGLAHYAIDKDEDISRANLIENVFLELITPKTEAQISGLFANAYAYRVNNVFVSLKTADGSTLDASKTSLVNNYTGFWFPSGNGTISSSIFYSSSKVKNTISTSSYGQTIYKDVVTTTSLMEAFTYAFNILNNNVWNVFATSYPTLKTGIN